MALTNPDEYAWRLFIFLSRQAKPSMRGVADETKRFGELDPGAPVVWETWALTSGGDKSEVFKEDGSRPEAWDNLNRSANPALFDQNLERQVIEFDRMGAKARALAQKLKRRLPEGRQTFPGHALFVPPNFDDRQEVRMNRGAFEFIVNNEMYNIDGLEALLARARQTANRLLISLPPEAKEVKAEWLPIDEAQKGRYLWRQTIDDGGNKQLWGLVALHIITKDLPNWFWADFGHVDCESQLNACSTQGSTALLPPVDSATHGSNGAPGPSGTNGIRKETVGTVWANYILRGTQTNFTSATGSPTVLSNPVIEGGSQLSSCISCHAMAAVGPRISQDIHRLNADSTKIGIPDPSFFGDTSGFGPHTISFLQTDFMWSPITRAKRKKTDLKNRP